MASWSIFFSFNNIYYIHKLELVYDAHDKRQNKNHRFDR